MLIMEFKIDDENARRYANNDISVKDYNEIFRCVVNSCKKWVSENSQEYNWSVGDWAYYPDFNRSFKVSVVNIDSIEDEVGRKYRKDYCKPCTSPEIIIFKKEE